MFIIFITITYGGIVLEWLGVGT